MTTVTIASSPDAVAAPGRVVRLRFWAYAAADGELLQYGDDLCYLHGRTGVFPKVEAAVQGRAPGDRIEVDLQPEEAYGRRDPGLVIVQSKASIPTEAWQPGTVLEGELPDGRTLPFVVIGVHDDAVTLDANHPWADKPLHFKFEVMRVRDATAAELRAGYPLAPV